MELDDWVDDEDDEGGWDADDDIGIEVDPVKVWGVYLMSLHRLYAVFGDKYAMLAILLAVRAGHLNWNSYIFGSNTEKQFLPYDCLINSCLRLQ